MILADTSVWVAHLRRNGAVHLRALLADNAVRMHPYVLGELALGGLAPGVLRMLQDLPAVAVASPAEALGFISRWSLAGRGIGYVDAHLLASAKITLDTRVWSLDRKLDAAAVSLGLRYAVGR